MIKPTDEMVRAFSDADFSGCGNADWEDEHIRIGLAAVLAIVARDRCMQPRGHVYHPTAKPEGCSCPTQHCYGQDVGLGRQCRTVDRLARQPESPASATREGLTRD